MINAIFVRARVIARLQQNPLGPYLEQLAIVLHRQGYAPSSIQDCLRAGDKFGHWLQRQGHTVTRIDETLLNHYVSGLERHRSGNLCKAAAGLTHLFRLLRQQGVVIESPAKPPAPVDQWLMCYDHYLEQVVGVAVNTRERYQGIVRRFIRGYCGSDEPDWPGLTAQTITEFVRREAASRQGHARKVPSVAIRSFLRFLVFQGEIRSGLEAAAPTPPQWTHAALPAHLTPSQLRRQHLRAVDWQGS